MDVEFVGPHLPVANGPADVADGIMRLDAPAEGVAVGRKMLIVVVEFEGNEFEQHHLFGRKTVDHPFLAGAHLVHDLLLGNAHAFALDNLLCQAKICFLFHKTVGFGKLMPVEAAFQQPVGEEFLPCLLLDQLCDDALHDEK